MIIPMQTQHTQLRSAYPQFCRLSNSLLPQLSIKDTRSLNFHKNSFSSFQFNFLHFAFFSLLAHVKTRALGKHEALRCWQIFQFFQSFFSFFRRFVLLFNPHVARHMKMDLFYSFTTSFLDWGLNWTHQADIPSSKSFCPIFPLAYTRAPFHMQVVY